MADSGAWATWLRERLAERGWKPADVVNGSDGQVSSPQMSRWLSGSHQPSWDSVRAVCRVLGVPAVEGMIRAGLLSPDDVGVKVVEQVRPLSERSHRELLDEIARRLDGLQPGSGKTHSAALRALEPGAEGERQAARRRRP